MPNKETQNSPAFKVNADQLGLCRSQFPAAATDIVIKLQSHGHQAFIVGGGVRDLLLNTNPKDFDVSTDAEPEKIKAIFGSKCRIIGRRFRLAHVRAQRHIIEVATFRGHHSNAQPSEDQPPAEPVRRRSPTDSLPAGASSLNGLVLRDNVYGTLEEDAFRRDFTVNALYYDPTSHTIIDYCHGLKDIKSKTLRIIGEPDKRYREDPVRLLRAVRLSKKLGLTIAPGTLDLLPQLSPLLHQVSAARLFDEVLKFFLSGDALNAYHGLLEHDLLHILVPETQEAITHHPHSSALIEQVMKNTDERLAVGKPVTPAFLFAALLWHPLLKHHKIIMTTTRLPLFPALHRAMDQVISNQIDITAIPRRFSRPMQDIWEMQFRLTKRTPKNVYKMLAHPKFRAGYDMLLLREQSEEIPTELGPWWTQFQFADEDEQKKMLSEIPKPETQKKRKKNKSNKKSGSRKTNPQGD